MYPTTPFLVLAISGIALAQSDCARIGGPFQTCLNAIKCPASLQSDLTSCECSIALAQLQCYNAFCAPNLPDLASLPVSYSSQYCPSASRTVQLVTVTALPSSGAGAGTTTAAGGSATAGASTAAGVTASAAGGTSSAAAPASTSSKAAANGLVAPVGGIMAVLVGLLGVF